MAEKRPLTIGASGYDYLGTTDTLPEGNIPSLPTSKITSFTEEVQDLIAAMLVEGTGITITYDDGAGTITITNDDPDQTVVLNAGTGISISGTYPNFTVTNSAPDQTVAITAGAGISVSGTYPNFTVTATGATGETYTAGENLAARDLVYISGTQMFKADANTASKLAMGFVTSSVTSGASGTFYRGAGKISGYTGLTADAFYVLSNTTPGGIALFSALTFANPDIIQFVGKAESTTVLAFSPSVPTLVTA